ncbi:hypothetical protein P170DRAFT_446341 [Aspergillus steynii IBT 23096]|uniref:Rhodopsin domain-containing protein n=1 Tax=Aspergillus steynii IBT 23096 TaxID=1392250 RepID=A0A2I2GEB4_9EURO|nr:uncharacterized protein P170DRAFT_446341 [Aspergillus steynii IBT 23096]PLB51213.1 hypothetical protein P170DRAFT_446341 [Aspergillus steynii IBT 23096]
MSPLSPTQIQALLERPAVSPPPGQASNLDDPPNLLIFGRTIILLAWILSSMLILIRVYTKIVVVRKFRMSDYAMLLAWGLFMGYLVMGWKINELAPGVDQWNIRLRDFIKMYYYFHIDSIIYGIIIFFIKLSILLQYLEIFSVQRDFFFWACHGLIWVNFVFYAIRTFLEIFACRYLSETGGMLRIDGACPIETMLISIVSSAINSASDIIILILIQIRIWRLHMTLHKKSSVSVVFLFGLLATVASILGVAYTVFIYTKTNNSYNSWCAGVWTVIEIACGIIAGCLPSFSRFLRNISQSAFISELGGFLHNMVSSSSSKRRKDPDVDVDKTRRVPDQYPLASFAPGTQLSLSSTVAADSLRP